MVGKINLASLTYIRYAHDYRYRLNVEVQCARDNL